MAHRATAMRVLPVEAHVDSAPLSVSEAAGRPLRTCHETRYALTRSAAAPREKEGAKARRVATDGLRVRSGNVRVQLQDPTHLARVPAAAADGIDSTHRPFGAIDLQPQILEVARGHLLGVDGSAEGAPLARVDAPAVARVVRLQPGRDGVAHAVFGDHAGGIAHSKVLDNATVVVAIRLEKAGRGWLFFRSEPPICGDVPWQRSKDLEVHSRVDVRAVGLTCAPLVSAHEASTLKAV